MKIFLTVAILGALLAGNALAAWDPLQITVKVRSGLCRSNDIDFRGSGVLLRIGSQTFVLTSEHVVLHGNDDVCHTIDNDEVGVLHARLVEAGWSQGLALLEIPGFSSPIELPGIDDIATDMPVQGSAPVIAGVPYDFDRVLATQSGTVLVSASHRHFLPTPSDATEVVNSHGEFGMSGGPALDPTKSRIVGILSHQFLTIAAGQRPLVGEYSQQADGVKNHLLLIPGPSIRRWIEGVLKPAGERPKPLFVKNAEDQISGSDVVYTSGLSFQATPDDAPNCVAIRERNSTGGDPVGVGGDAVGVGGDNGQGTGPIKIVVRRNDLSREQTAWYLPERANWPESIFERLVRPFDVTITGLAIRDSETGQLSRQCVYSLQEFFRKLTSDRVNPITLASGSETGGTASILQEIRSASSGVVTKLGQLESSPDSDGWSRVVRAFFERVRAVDQIAQSGSWDLLSPSDVGQLADLEVTYRLAWRELFARDFDGATNLLSQLRYFQRELTKVKVE